MIKICVFSNKQFSGVYQFLHSVDEDELKNIQPEIFDAYDHTYFSFDESSQSTQVRFFNLAGEIQLCGSGAFALAKYLFSQFELDQLKFKTRRIELVAKKAQSQLSLELPILPFDQRYLINDYLVFSFLKQGIYIVQLENVDKVKMADWRSIYQEIGSPQNIHGLCIFSLDQEMGFLRYFVPWHGREEDYVTGSIHQYLSSILQKEFQKKSLQWSQLSSLPGELRVNLKGKSCFLSELT